ncbi:MAG: PhzF family phenazine biosynthesis protein [Candidatus Binatia bacterium]
MDFYITDVFGQEKYSGNQLATFLHCGDVSDREMQQIAREINFSETTFVLSDRPRDGGYDVRIFTPAAEIDFAGHPTLGTAFVIQQYLIGHAVEQVVLNLRVGPVPVRFPMTGDEPLLWMRQAEPTFGPQLEVTALTQVLSLAVSDFAEHWPIEQVSTGLPHLIVPLKHLDALKRARIVREHYNALVQQTWAKAIFIFSPESYAPTHDLSARMFADYYGVPEDPATGSGNGSLAAYLVKHRYFGESPINLRVGQGFEIGRPSILALQAAEEQGRISVSVGGQVIPVAKGQWL